MKKVNVISSIALVLSCSVLFASPVAHYHGARSHSHNLPGTGMAHNHGSLPAGSLTKTTPRAGNNSKIYTVMATAPTRISNDYKRIIAVATPRERVAMIDALAQLQGTLIVGSVADKYQDGILGIKRHKAQSKNEIKTACNDYARQLQNRVDRDNTKKMQLNKFASERCVAKAFKMLRFSGATSTSYSSSTPVNTLQGKVKNKIEGRVKERLNEVKKRAQDKIKDKLRSTLSKFF